MQVIQMWVELLRWLVNLWTEGTSLERASDHWVVDVVLVCEIVRIENLSRHHAQRGLALEGVVAGRTLGVAISLLVVGLA